MLLPPTHVSVPALFNVRCDSVTTPALVLIVPVPPAASVVLPVPAIVPPVQLKVVFTVAAAFPFNIPIDRLRVFTDSVPFAVTVPPAIASAPLLIVDG